MGSEFLVHGKNIAAKSKTRRPSEHKVVFPYRPVNSDMVACCYALKSAARLPLGLYSTIREGYQYE